MLKNCISLSLFCFYTGGFFVPMKIFRGSGFTTYFAPLISKRVPPTFLPGISFHNVSLFGASNVLKEFLLFFIFSIIISKEVSNITRAC